MTHLYHKLSLYSLYNHFYIVSTVVLAITRVVGNEIPIEFYKLRNYRLSTVYYIKEKTQLTWLLAGGACGRGAGGPYPPLGVCLRDSPHQPAVKHLPNTPW
jgi:hypothetical protein